MATRPPPSDVAICQPPPWLRLLSNRLPSGWAPSGSITERYCTVLRIRWFYWVVLGCTGLYWVLLACYCVRPDGQLAPATMASSSRCPDLFIPPNQFSVDRIKWNVRFDQVTSAHRLIGMKNNAASKLLVQCFLICQ